jgi:hypothetical protein
MTEEIPEYLCRYLFFADLDKLSNYSFYSCNICIIMMLELIIVKTSIFKYENRVEVKF